MNCIVITDLDGTLLDHDTYSFAEAMPALRRLKQLAVPVIPCTSKTRAETGYWMNRLDLDGPFVVENGGAVYVPRNMFPFPHDLVPAGEGWSRLELGASYAQLRSQLKAAAFESGCQVTGFGDWSVEEIASICDLPPDQAAMARQREFDEPFLIEDQQKACLLLGAIERKGLCWSRGGRFYHIHGANDKAEAVKTLASWYRQWRPGVRVIGLGDGLNDASFLRETDTAILLPSPVIEELMRRIPGGIRAPEPGPRGWNEALMRLLNH